MTAQWWPDPGGAGGEGGEGGAGGAGDFWPQVFLEDDVGEDLTLDIAHLQKMPRKQEWDH
jgi:hypothetical protein